MEVLITGTALHDPVWLFQRGPQRHVGFYVELESGELCPVVAEGPLAELCERSVSRGVFVIIIGYFQDGEVLAQEIEIL